MTKINIKLSPAKFSERLISTTDIVMSLSIGVFMSIIVNFSYISKFLSTDGTDYSEVISKETNQILSRLNFSVTDSQFGSVLTTAIVWSLIGMVVYIVVHFLFSLFRTAEEGVVISRSYIHPKNFNTFSFWVSVFSFILYPLVLIALFFIWIFFTLSYLIPLSEILFRIALYSDGSIIYSSLYILLSVLIVSFSVLGFLLLAKLLHQIGKIFI